MTGDVERAMDGSSGHCLAVSRGLIVTFDLKGSLVCAKRNI